MTSERRDDLPPLKASELRVGSVLANGGFATVFKGSYRGSPVAIKAVPRAQDTQHATFSIRCFVHESKILSSLSTECAPRPKASIRSAPAGPRPAALAARLRARRSVSP